MIYSSRLVQIREIWPVEIIRIPPEMLPFLLIHWSVCWLRCSMTRRGLLSKDLLDLFGTCENRSSSMLYNGPVVTPQGVSSHTPETKVGRNHTLKNDADKKYHRRGWGVSLHCLTDHRAPNSTWFHNPFGFRLCQSTSFPWRFGYVATYHVYQSSVQRGVQFYLPVFPQKNSFRLRVHLDTDQFLYEKNNHPSSSFTQTSLVLVSDNGWFCLFPLFTVGMSSFTRFDTHMARTPLSPSQIYCFSGTSYLEMFIHWTSGLTPVRRQVTAVTLSLSRRRTLTTSCSTVDTPQPLVPEKWFSQHQLSWKNNISGITCPCQTTPPHTHTPTLTPTPTNSHTDWFL